MMPPPLPRSRLIEAIRGPLMLTTLGVLLALDQTGGWSFFENTWPVLIILFGVMKLLEYVVPRSRPIVATPDDSDGGGPPTV